MQLVRRFSLIFPKPSAENQYQLTKNEQAQQFFKIILILLACYCLFGVASSAIHEDYELLGPYGLLMILCAVFFFCFKKIRRFTPFFLVFTCLAISSCIFVAEKIIHGPHSCNAAILKGFIFASFERVVNQRLPGIKLKIILSLALYILRTSLFFNDEISIHILHTIFSIINLVVEFWKEKEDRRLFQDFYDYKQSLVKFKTLLVSGLSSNIFILSKDLSEIFFKNDHPLDNINTSRRPSTIREQAKLYEWLNQLILSKDLFNDSSKSAYSKDGSPTQEMTVLKTLKTLSSEDFLSNQQKFSFSAEFHRNPHDKKVYEVKVFGLVWDGKEAMAVILNDVTEHYQNLTLKIADTNKDRMLAMISHELKTPLNGILCVVTALEKEIKQPHLLSFLKVCRNSGELLLNLVNSILDLQHIRDHKFVLRPTKESLFELLSGIYSLFKLQFDQKCLDLELNIAADVPEYIITDQNRLRQVLINLIGNAFKFTFTGGVSIQVQVDPLQDGYVQFKVKDSGIGIREEDKKKLFKMYGRLDQPHPNLNNQGTGFGLEISDQLARLLADNMEDGGIKLESEEGVGSVFSFSVKDEAIPDPDLECSYQTQELHFHEPKVFAEDIEDISIKLSPYSSQFGTSDKLVSPKLSELIHKGHFDFSIGSPTSSRALLRSTSSSPTRRDPSKFFFSSIKTKSKLAPEKIHSNNSSHNSKPFYLKQQPSIARSITNKSLKSARSGRSNTNKSRGSDKSRNNGFSDGSFNSSLHNTKKIETRIETEDKLKILVVDDNTFNLMVAKHLVQGWGYVAETALNGKLAIQEVLKANKTSHKFTVILMDLQMPVMDGYEATVELRKMMTNKEIPEIPIIAVSANDSEDDKRRCKEVGMFGHLSKPLYEDNLRDVLNKALNIKEMTEQSYITGEENV